MNCTISSINYCPVKSLSFQSIQSCEITKNLGMANDRIFAFSKSIILENANILSLAIPRFFVISHDCILWNDTDLTGQ